MSVSDRDREALEDIMAFGREAQDVVSRGRSSYDEDLMLQRAAQMICVNLGEAAKRLSPGVVDLHPEIRVKMMIALGDKVADGYRILDAQVIWETIARAIPEDIAGVQALLESEG